MIRIVLHWAPPIANHLLAKTIAVFCLIILFEGRQALASATSLQVFALAPNAGGQEAYSLRRLNDDREWNFFLNTSINTSGIPLMGVSYAARLSLCGSTCIWDFYLEAGAGLSSGGPMIEFLWGTTWFWLLRIDFSTQIFISTERAIIWNYPFWAGISVPF